MKNDFKIDGDTTVIFLTEGEGVYECHIDTQDLPKLLSVNCRWCVEIKEGRKSRARSNDKGKKVLMHRFLLEAPKKVRYATQALNMQNISGDSSEFSGIRGIEAAIAVKSTRAKPFSLEGTG
ncbi:hypothetical protein [Paenibacillus sp. NPDC057967]|uniref:hypothetical protein n=1 Tax=Paenibacillus sp. NPDC057967 TaxID=3346293 RepID=UPI0036DB336C